MTKAEVINNAMLQAVCRQRNELADKVAMLEGEIAGLRAENAELIKRLSVPVQKADPLLDDHIEPPDAHN